MDSTGRQMTGTALTRFPLVQRSRPPGFPLTTRVNELRELVAQPHDGDSGIVRMAEVCNKAALITSDCGLPDLARTLCWRQHEVFEHARPLPTSATKLALQPVLNIARQLIREGDGDGAYTMLKALFRATCDRTNAVIDGRSVNLGNLTGTPADHKEVCMLVWAALLADGARALALAGRWRQAAEHTDAHRGLGMRLLDGRQVTILALVHEGQTSQAAKLVEQSTIVDPWEHVVQHLLRVHCQHATHAGRHIASMLSAVLALLEELAPSTAVFGTRVGMTALDLAEPHDHPQLRSLRAALIATAQSDAYAARDVLAHPLLRPTMTAAQHQDLTTLANASGLDTKTIPEPLYDDLMAAVSSAEDRLRTLLKHGPRDRTRG